MTAVCSLGLDMIVVPGDISRDALAGIIADVMAIGMINSKTTGARLIPAAGKKVGDWVTLGGLFGEAPVMEVSTAGNERLRAARRAHPGPASVPHQLAGPLATLVGSGARPLTPTSAARRLDLLHHRADVLGRLGPCRAPARPSPPR